MDVHSWMSWMDQEIPILMAARALTDNLEHLAQILEIPVPVYQCE